MKVEIENFYSYEYPSVWLITKYKDGCIYDTKFICHAKIEDVSSDRISSNIKHITISSFTPEKNVKIIKKHPNNRFVPYNVLWTYYQFESLTREEIIKIVNAYYKS